MESLLKITLSFGLPLLALVLERAVENTVVNGRRIFRYLETRGYRFRTGPDHGGNDGIVNSSENNRPSETAQWNLINGSERLTATGLRPGSWTDTLSAVLGSRVLGRFGKISVPRHLVGSTPTLRLRRRTWLRYDFDKPYSIDKIVLAFLIRLAASKPQKKRI